MIFGADAHQPERFLNNTAEEKALALVAQYGLHRIETVELKKL